MKYTFYITLVFSILFCSFIHADEIASKDELICSIKKLSENPKCLTDIKKYIVDNCETFTIEDLITLKSVIKTQRDRVRSRISKTLGISLGLGLVTGFLLAVVFGDEIKNPDTSNRVPLFLGGALITFFSCCMPILIELQNIENLLESF